MDGPTMGKGINLWSLKILEGSDQKLYNQGNRGGLHWPDVKNFKQTSENLSADFWAVSKVVQCHSAWMCIATRLFEEGLSVTGDSWIEKNCKTLCQALWLANEMRFELSSEVFLIYVVSRGSLAFQHFRNFRLDKDVKNNVSHKNITSTAKSSSFGFIFAIILSRQNQLTITLPSPKRIRRLWVSFRLKPLVLSHREHFLSSVCLSHTSHPTQSTRVVST